MGPTFRIRRAWHDALRYHPLYGLSGALFTRGLYTPFQIDGLWRACGIEAFAGCEPAGYATTGRDLRLRDERFADPPPSDRHISCDRVRPIDASSGRSIGHRGSNSANAR